MEFKIKKPEHLSPSTINSFIEYRSQWFANKILNAPFIGNVNMARGTGIEHGLNYFVMYREAKNWGLGKGVQDDEGSLIEAAMKEARDKFIEESKRFEESRDEIQAMIDSVDNGTIEAIHNMSQQWGNEIPVMQHHISCMLPGCSIPCIGYLDYKLHDKIQDLKTAGQKPSGLKQGYILQGSIYRYATGLPVEFCFVVPLKTKTDFYTFTLTDEEYEWGLGYAAMAAQKIELVYKLLSKPFAFSEPNDIAEVFAAMAFPNMDGFFRAKEKAIHQSIWGIKEKAPPKKTPFGGFSGIKK